jgi:hypothetical protein
MEEDVKKKFRDTKVGRFLKEKLPKVLDVAGNLTGIDALNVVSNLISGEELNQEDTVELQKLIIEQQRIELENVQSARNREAAYVTALEKPDYFQWIVGSIGLTLLVVVVVNGLFFDILNREVYFHVLGIIEGIALSIFTYYFGSSLGSKKKNNNISNIINNIKR